MRNIATCYSEHAVKVSDSYCSGPLTSSTRTSYVSPKSTPSIQNAVSHTYKSKVLSDQKRQLFITITWYTKLICQGFFIRISDKLSASRTGAHQKLSKTKGNIWLDSNSNPASKSKKFQVHWDLTSAKFEASPVPLGSYYIIVLVESRVALILGDMAGDPVVEEIIRGSVSPYAPTMSLVSQYEHFSGQFTSPISTRARFCDSGPDHEITIKCGPEDDGPRSPVLMDKKRVVRVKRLQWNFRGNQVIFVDGLLVDVMWDVHGWYFDHHQTLNNNKNNNKGGCGLIMLRTRSGLASRLWLEEEEKKLVEKNHDKPCFSLLILASSKGPG